MTIVSLNAADRKDQYFFYKNNRIPVSRRGADRIAHLEHQVEDLLAKMNIAIIHGGNKDDDGAVIHRAHNPRSWKSYEVVARDIAKSLMRLGAKNVKIFADDMKLVQKLSDNDIDFAWLNTGGVQGFASVAHAASMLEMLGIPYVGHDPLNAALMDSKHNFKRQMIGCGIPTARFIVWHGSEGTFDAASNNTFQKFFGDYAGPFIVKPVSGRASLNVEFVETRADLAEVMQSVFDVTENHILVEEFLPGREYCVAACGSVIAKQGRLNKLDGPFAFCTIERALESDEKIFTSMDKRPITAERIRLLDPASDAEKIEKLHQLAFDVVKALDIETLIRLDVRENADGELFVLEANPKPDLKAEAADGTLSIVAAALGECGMSYDDLILSLVADQIDVLMSRRRGAVNHLLRYLEEDKIITKLGL